jgi:hypothetical protein
LSRRQLLAHCGVKGSGGVRLLRPGCSDVNLFRYRKGIINFDAEVPYGTFDLGVTEEDLHGTQITGTSVNQGSLGPL